jgi:hypothetical protein
MHSEVDCKRCEGNPKPAYTVGIRRRGLFFVIGSPTDRYPLELHLLLDPTATLRDVRQTFPEEVIGHVQICYSPNQDLWLQLPVWFLPVRSVQLTRVL